MSLQSDALQVTTFYAVDGEDRLEAVDLAWQQFARDNGAAWLAGDVVGRPLWDFVAGAETRRVYRVIFQRVRQRESGTVVPFRCDSPSTRRLMVLDLSPGAQGRIELRAKLLRSETREPVRLLNPAFPRNSDFLTICSWCKQVLLPTGRWAEADEAVGSLGLFMAPQLPRLTQGICSACEARVSEL